MNKINTCQALDSDGKRCPNKIFAEVNYHGDSEIYHYNYERQDLNLTWVKIYICKKHAIENFSKIGYIKVKSKDG